MGIRKALAILFVIGSGAFTCASAVAGPVHLDYHGTVTGYDFDNGRLSPYLPLGSVIDLSLDFNETWSDGTYSFADSLGPVSGTMSVGSANFVLNGAFPFAYSYNGNTGEVIWVEPQFAGTGPVLGGGDFFGLFAVITPSLTINSLFLGYGFTTTYPDGFSITNYEYAQMTPDRYSFTPVTPVPEPATLWLMAAGLLAVVAAKRKSLVRG